MKDFKKYWHSTFDAYTPEQMYHKVQAYSQSQVVMPVHKQLMLGMVAGGYIGLGCVFFVFLLAWDTSSSANLLLSGLVFSSGYIMAVLAGAEVFTCNNLQAMSWASGKISTVRLLQRWGLILFANAFGALGLVILILFSGILGDGNKEAGRFALNLAHNHVYLGISEIFFRAVLGNLLICIGIWISFAGRTVTDKLIPMALIISAVPILNLEHVAASLFYVPLGILLPIWYPEMMEPAVHLTFHSTSVYIAAVTAGNIIGGSGMVALVYYVVYRG